MRRVLFAVTARREAIRIVVARGRTTYKNIVDISAKHVDNHTMQVTVFYFVLAIIFETNSP